MCVTYWFGYTTTLQSWKYAAESTSCSWIAPADKGAYVKGAWLDLRNFAINEGVTRAYHNLFAIEVRWQLSNGTLVGQEAYSLVHSSDYGCTQMMGWYVATGICAIYSNVVGTDAGVYIAIA